MDISERVLKEAEGRYKGDVNDIIYIMDKLSEEELFDYINGVEGFLIYNKINFYNPLYYYKPMYIRNEGDTYFYGKNFTTMIIYHDHSYKKDCNDSTGLCISLRDIDDSDILYIRDMSDSCEIDLLIESFIEEFKECFILDVSKFCVWLKENGFKLNN